MGRGIEDVVLKSVERPLFRSSSVLLAEYHCPADDPLFVNSGPSNSHSIVFPLTSTRIICEGMLMYELPTLVALYNEGAEYTRQKISAEGSHCEWLTLEAGLLLGIMEMSGVKARDPGRPFRRNQVAACTELTMRQKSLFRYTRNSQERDALFIEEEAVVIVEEIAAGLRDEGRLRGAGSFARPQPAIVDQARDLLAARFAEPLSLGDVAREVGVSAAYLSRAFRAATGQTLHSFREQLRLRRALDLLPHCCGDFSTIALDLGYSSHSHFSCRFKREFGLTPSEFVKLAARGRAARETAVTA